MSSLNLSEFVNNEFSKDAYFDFDKFREVVRDGVVFLNEVLDEGLPLHPLQEQQETVRNLRQIGLGVMGIADMLIKLGIKYGEKVSLQISDRIAKVLINEALKQSALLAKEHGTYPDYANDIVETEFFKFVAEQDTVKLVKKYGLRNSQLLTIAPTGSISTMLGVSGGIEPIFDISYTRTTQTLHNEDVEYEVFTDIVEEYMNSKGIYSKDNLPNIFVTAHTLNARERIDIQSVWQKYIDASISSTVNLDNSATLEDIKDIYMYAWERGLKGITVYRDGCARSGILGTKSEENKTEVSDLELIEQNICPDCKGELINTGGCHECVSCGFSPCSI